MSLDLLIPPRDLISCHGCRESIRAVELVTGGIIFINAEPDPDGDIIPWPPKEFLGVAQARRMNPVIETDTRWSEHACR